MRKRDMILRAIHEYGCLTVDGIQREVWRKFGLHLYKQDIRSALLCMSADGLVCRYPPRSDNYRLTPKGKALLSLPSGE